jgi:hypothetical protein
MKKKMAVCISGHLRHPRKGYEAFKRCLIDPNPDWEFDFYISTWDVQDWRRGNEKLRDFSEIYELFDPKVLHVEKERAWDTSKFQKYIKPGDVKKGTKGEHILAMFYKINAAWDLISCSGKRDYNLFMRWRTDIDLCEVIDLNAVRDIALPHPKQHISQRSIFVSKNRTNKKEWASDVFAIGEYQGMLRYSQFYKAQLSDTIHEIQVFRPEVLMNSLLDSMTVNIVEFSGDWKVIYE